MGMGYIWGFLPLLIRRALATPHLLAIRFVGVLVAVTLVAGVSLYSDAMGDAMLQQRVQTDPDALNFAVSQTGRALAPASFSALTGYIQHTLASDLHLPLYHLQIHHATEPVPLFRLTPQRRLLGHTPLATLGLDYYNGLSQYITLIAGAMPAGAQSAGGDAPVLISAYTARSLRLHVGERLAFSATPTKALTPYLV